MTPKPGRIVCEVRIELCRPRDITETRCNDYNILGIFHPAADEA